MCSLSLRHLSGLNEDYLSGPMTERRPRTDGLFRIGGIHFLTLPNECHPESVVILRILTEPSSLPQMPIQ